MNVSKKWKDITNEKDNLNEESASCDYKWLKNLRLIDCVDIKTSSSHWQYHQVIDEKISDRIVISSIESRDYSVQRSNDSLITLIYWRNLNSSSFLDVRSYIYLREESRVYENDQNAFFTINQLSIERLRLHIYTNNLFNIYVT